MRMLMLEDLQSSVLTSVINDTIKRQRKIDGHQEHYFIFRKQCINFRRSVAQFFFSRQQTYIRSLFLFSFSLFLVLLVVVFLLFLLLWFGKVCCCLRLAPAVTVIVVAAAAARGILSDHQSAVVVPVRLLLLVHVMSSCQSAAVVRVVPCPGDANRGELDTSMVGLDLIIQFRGKN
jgi:hypothetical protein